jgi:hypothetical protein
LLENDHCPANVITRLGLFEMCRKELHKEFKETNVEIITTKLVCRVRVEIIFNKTGMC